MPFAPVTEADLAPEGMPHTGGFAAVSEADLAPEVGMGESAARGALQGATMGFGDEAAAAIDTAVSAIPGIRTLAQHFQAADLPALDNPSVSYQQRRDAYRQKNAAAQEANPITYGAGELAGGLATGKALPTVGKGLIGAVGSGAIAGGIGALGGSNADLTQGQFAQAGQDVLHGAGLGGALGGLAHVIGSKVAGGAEDRMTSDVATDVSGRARPKDQLQIRRNMLAGKGDADISGRDVIMGERTKPIIDAARAGKTTEAIELIKPQVAELEAAKAVPYKTVDAVTKGVPVDSITGAIDRRIGELAKATGTKAERSVLSAVRKDVEETFAGQARIPTEKLRETVTSAQRSAIEALGTIAETEHARLAAEGKQVLEGVLRDHLNQAANVSPGARAAVQQIRNINKQQSILLSFKTGLEQKAAKELLQKQTVAQTAKNGIGQLVHMGGIGAALTGHPAALGALALPAAGRLAASGARLGNDTLARILYRASQGDQRAMSLLHTIRSLPNGLAQLAGQGMAR